MRSCSINVISCPSVHDVAVLWLYSLCYFKSNRRDSSNTNNVVQGEHPQISCGIGVMGWLFSRKPSIYLLKSGCPTIRPLCIRAWRALARQQRPAGPRQSGRADTPRLVSMKQGKRLRVITNRKLHMHFRLVMKSTTLDDLKWPICTLTHNTC